MFLNEIDIKYIEFNVLSKKNGSILKEKYFYFDDDSDRDDDGVFMSLVMECLIRYKGSDNIEIDILSDRIVINCFYTKLFGKNGSYTKVIKGYLKLMHDIEKYHDTYLEIIEKYN